MIWITINIFLAIAGGASIRYAFWKDANQRDDIGVAWWIIVGVFFLAVLVISELLRWWLG